MKKIVSILTVTILLFAACRKEEATIEKITPADGKPYSIKNGIVVFNSISAYRSFLDNMTTADRAGFIAAVEENKAFKPLDRNARMLNRGNNSGSRLILTGNDSIDDDVEDMLDSEFLTHLINADGIVQIGEYLFNIDMVTQKCYAMHTYWNTTDSGRIIYNYLYEGNSHNIYIFEFSTDQEVLEELEILGFPRSKKDLLQQPDLPGLFCRDRHGSGQKISGVEPFVRPYHFYRHKCKANYQKAGVYFALYGKIIQQYNDCNYYSRSNTDAICFWQKGWWRSNTIMFNWRFKPRCWSERNQPYTTETSYTDQERKTWAWESSRGLAKYDFTIQWRADGILCLGQYHTTQIYHISDGY